MSELPAWQRAQKDLADIINELQSAINQVKARKVRGRTVRVITKSMPGGKLIFDLKEKLESLQDLIVKCVHDQQRETDESDTEWLDNVRFDPFLTEKAHRTTLQTAYYEHVVDSLVNAWLHTFHPISRCLMVSPQWLFRHHVPDEENWSVNPQPRRSLPHFESPSISEAGLHFGLNSPTSPSAHGLSNNSRHSYHSSPSSPMFTGSDTLDDSAYFGSPAQSPSQDQPSSSDQYLASSPVGSPGMSFGASLNLSLLHQEQDFLSYIPNATVDEHNNLVMERGGARSRPDFTTTLASDTFRQSDDLLLMIIENKLKDKKNSVEQLTRYLRDCGGGGGPVILGLAFALTNTEGLEVTMMYRFKATQEIRQVEFENGAHWISAVDKRVLHKVKKYMKMALADGFRQLLHVPIEDLA